MTEIVFCIEPLPLGTKRVQKDIMLLAERIVYSMQLLTTLFGPEVHDIYLAAYLSGRSWYYEAKSVLGMKQTIG